MLDDVIHVVMSSSKVFLPYCATTMASILFNLDPNRKINFYILSYDIDDKDKKNLRLLSKIKECNVFFPSFDEKLLDMFTGIKIPSHVSKMTYARILIPTIIPTVDKAIFIDADTIVRTDISKLYDIPLEQNYFAMVEDACGQHNCKYMWGDTKTKYFNCGVMLINACLLRNDNYLKQIEQVLHERMHVYRICDQDVLNDVFRNRILSLNITWNFHHEKFVNLGWCNKKNFKDYDSSLADPNIIHCTGPQKPWLLLLNNRYKDEFYFYNRLTKFYKHFKIQRYTVDKKMYFSVSIMERILFSIIRNEGQSLGLGSTLLIKIKRLLFCKKIQNARIKYCFLGIPVIKKLDTENKKYLKLFGIPVYYKKSPKVLKVDNSITFNTNAEFSNVLCSLKSDLSSLRNDITTLKRDFSLSEERIKELVYRSSYIPSIVREHHEKVLWPYKDIYKGKSIVICGAGPSLVKYKPMSNCVHIGLNRVFERKEIKFDYIFAWDLANLMKDDPLFYKKLLDYPAKKILGKFINDDLAQVNEEIQKELDAITVYSSARYGLLSNIHDPIIHDDLHYYPLMDFGSVVFGALHFAIYTGATKIYLVGIDNSLNGYFTEQYKQRFLQTNEIYSGFQKVRRFMSAKHPSVEIISINPVGLKGLFNDIYT